MEAKGVTGHKGTEDKSGRGGPGRTFVFKWKRFEHV